MQKEPWVPLHVIDPWYHASEWDGERPGTAGLTPYEVGRVTTSRWLVDHFPDTMNILVCVRCVVVLLEYHYDGTWQTCLPHVIVGSGYRGYPLAIRVLDLSTLSVG